MIRYRLHGNVLIELPRVRSERSLKRNRQDNRISFETLEKAKEFCAGLKLPKLKVEVVENFRNHSLYKEGDEECDGLYFEPFLIPDDYGIEKNTGLILIQEDDEKFLLTLAHEFGHAIESKIFKGDFNCEDRGELWAEFFAFIALSEQGFKKEADECWEEVLEYKRNLKRGVKKKRKCLTIFS